jgi:hypothetical protein
MLYNALAFLSLFFPSFDDALLQPRPNEKNTSTVTTPFQQLF